MLIAPDLVIQRYELACDGPIPGLKCNEAINDPVNALQVDRVVHRAVPAQSIDFAQASLPAGAADFLTGLGKSTRRRQNSDVSRPSKRYCTFRSRDSQGLVSQLGSKYNVRYKYILLLEISGGSHDAQGQHCTGRLERGEVCTRQITPLFPTPRAPAPAHGAAGLGAGLSRFSCGVTRRARLASWILGFSSEPACASGLEHPRWEMARKCQEWTAPS